MIAFYLGGLTVMVCGLGMVGRLTSFRHWWVCFAWPIEIALALAGWALQKRKRTTAEWFD